MTARLLIQGANRIIMRAHGLRLFERPLAMGERLFAMAGAPLCSVARRGANARAAKCKPGFTFTPWSTIAAPSSGMEAA
jgi:hypothetical protein